MGAIEWQRRPLYAIGTVARLTGVKADTLRIWERRYQLGASHKSATGRRQYTQSDLEHLQLVSALVASGTRIGEIASSERRTLEALLCSRDQNVGAELSKRKPSIVFVGTALCDWLGKHQGCLANVDALLAPCSLAEFAAAGRHEHNDVDSLVVHLATRQEIDAKLLAALGKSVGNGNVLILHSLGESQQLQALSQKGFVLHSFPPEPGFLAFHVNLSTATSDARQGQDGPAELVPLKPRLFDEAALSGVLEAQGEQQQDSPVQLAELVSALCAFEDDCAGSQVESWQDASLQACVCAYTGQARWLMERALRLVVDASVDRMSP